MALNAAQRGELEKEHLNALIKNIETTLKLANNDAILERMFAVFYTYIEHAGPKQLLALYNLILQLERGLQAFVIKELSPEDSVFFQKEWLPHAVMLTEILRAHALEDVDEELALYAENLSLSWLFRKVVPSVKANTQKIKPITLLPRITKKK